MDDVDSLTVRIEQLEEERDSLQDQLIEAAEELVAVNAKLAALEQLADTARDLVREAAAQLEKGDF
nr:hypothetical protein KPHV_60250 [Kitasatospora purpeofusca]